MWRLLIKMSPSAALLRDGSLLSFPALASARYRGSCGTVAKTDVTIFFRVVACWASALVRHNISSPDERPEAALAVVCQLSPGERLRDNA